MIGVAKIYSSSFPGSHLNIFWSPHCSQFHPYRSRSINPYDESFDFFPILFFLVVCYIYRFDSYHSLHVETEEFCCRRDLLGLLYSIGVSYDT